MNACPDPVLCAVSEVLVRRARVQAGDGVVVAVSGGIDSMVLIDALQRLAGELGLRLVAAHLDHGMRSESAEDAHFVAAEMARRGLDCRCGTADVPARAAALGLSPEEAARLARYAHLEAVRSEAGCRWVALGHHADDQAETVLLHLLRGAGSAGLGAMAAARQDGYLRPLLGLTRGQIAAYARRRGLVHRIDATNADTALPRNRIRHELLPLLEQRHNAAVRAALCRVAEILREEHGALDAITRTALETVTCARRPGLIALAAPQVVRYHIAVRRRLLRGAVKILSPHAEPPGLEAIDSLDGLSRHGGAMTLPGGIDAQASGPAIVLRLGPAPDTDRVLAVPGRTEMRARGLTVCARLMGRDDFGALLPGLGGWRGAFDADRVGRHLVARTRRRGDRLQPLGLEGHKLVSDLLAEARIPRLLRDEHPVIARGEEIVWVAGVRPAHPFRVRDQTRQVLLLQVHHTGLDTTDAGAMA